MGHENKLDLPTRMELQSKDIAAISERLKDKLNKTDSLPDKF